MPKITSIKLRRGTTTAWTTANPILSDGEIGWDSTAGKFKVGNGTSAWAALTYVTDAALAAKIDASTKGAANGVASLDSSGKVPSGQLPAAVYGTSQMGTFSARPSPTSVSAGTIYYATDVSEQYRSDGTLWRVVGSGGNELAFAELATNFVTSSSTKVDVPGLTATFIAGERPIEVRMTALVQADAAAGRPTLHLVFDGTVVAEIPNRIDPTAYGYMIFERVRRLPLMTAGSTHTVKVQASSTGGNITIFGVSVNPAELSVINR